MDPAFDTHKAVKDITEVQAGLAALRTTTEAEFKAVRADIKAVRADIKDVRENMATKDDIKAIWGALEHTATKTDLELLSKSMTIRLGLMFFAAFAAMIALFNATN